MSYQNDINKYKILTIEEETSLFNDFINEGDAKAFDKIIRHNLQNVRNICLNFFRRNNFLELDELIANGNEALVKCALKFDPTKGNRFYTYLRGSVINSLVRAINENKNVKTPENKMILFGKIDVNGIHNFSDKNIRDYELYSNVVYVRFTDKNDTDNENNHGTFDIEDESLEFDAIQKENIAYINLFLELLDDEEIFILNHFYGLNDSDKYTLNKISNKLGFSKSKTSSLKGDAIKKIIKKLNDE